MVVGRLTKEMKKAELMEQLTEANETYDRAAVCGTLVQ